MDVLGKRRKDNDNDGVLEKKDCNKKTDGHCPKVVKHQTEVVSSSTFHRHLRRFILSQPRYPIVLSLLVVAFPTLLLGFARRR